MGDGDWSVRVPILFLVDRNSFVDPRLLCGEKQHYKGHKARKGSTKLLFTVLYTEALEIGFLHGPCHPRRVVRYP